jgi:nucleotide-binding universal stress UspA family protein
MFKDPEVSTILYSTDLGGQTQPVFRHALNMANHYGADIIMVHVVEPLGDSANAVINTYLPKDLIEKVKKDSMKDLLETMTDRLKKFYQDEYEGKNKSRVKKVMVVSGKPSEEILRMAEEENADMIITGKSTRKVRGVRVMGSTARRVSRMSRVPVLVVPNY